MKQIKLICYEPNDTPYCDYEVMIPKLIESLEWEDISDEDLILLQYYQYHFNSQGFRIAFLVRNEDTPKTLGEVILAAKQLKKKNDEANKARMKQDAERVAKNKAAKLAKEKKKYEALKAKFEDQTT
jgi:hypothetical protein